MAEPIDDFLVRLLNKSPKGLLDRVPHYIHGHLAECQATGGNIVAEWQRLAAAITEKAPDGELKEHVLNIICEEPVVG